MLHFYTSELTSERRKAQIAVLRKLLKSIADDPSCQSMWRSFLKKNGNLPIDKWPESESAEFLSAIDALFDMSVLFDDASLVAFSMDSHANERNPKRIFKPNGTNSCLLILTTAGSGTALLPDPGVNFDAGDLILAHPGVPLNLVRATDAQKWEFCCVGFKPQPYLNRWLDWGTSHKSLMKLHASDDVLRKLQFLFEELVSIGGMTTFAHRELELNLLEQILVRCSQLVPTMQDKIDPRISAAKNFIQTNLTKNICLDEVAKAAGLSRSRLLVLFREHFGMGVMEWRDSQRIKTAATLLHNSELSITDVARRVGYSDPLYFSRVFKRHLNVSPSSVRN